MLFQRYDQCQEERGNKGKDKTRFELLTNLPPCSVVMPVCRRGYKGVRILMCVCIRTRDALRDTCIKGGVAGVTINKGQAYLRQQDYTRHPIYSGVALYTVSVTIFLIFVAAVFTIFLNFSDRQLPRTKMHRYAVLFMHQLTASQRLKACMHGH